MAEQKPKYWLYASTRKREFSKISVPIKDATSFNGFYKWKALFAFGK